MEPAQLVMKPIQCHLWTTEILTDQDINTTFDVVETFAESSHFSRRLLRCRACGQLYLKEFYEEIDWADGDDPQYETFIPVRDRAQAVEVNRADRMRIHSYLPRMNRDAPKAGMKKIYWVGRET